MVLATQKCHCRAASWAALHTRRCLLTNKSCAQPEPQGPAVGGRGTHEPPEPVVSSASVLVHILPAGTLSPPDPEHHRVTPTVPAAASRCVPHGCPCPQPFPQPSLPHTCPTRPSGTHLSRRTTPSMHAPKSTTELMSAGRSRTACKVQSPRTALPSAGTRLSHQTPSRALPVLLAHPPIRTQSPDRALKDTDCRGDRKSVV